MSSLSLYSTVGKTSWFTLQGYYAENFPSYRMKRHSHKRIEVMYAVSGSFFIEMRCKEKWKAMPIRLGEMIVIDSEAPHSLLIPAGGEARILNLEMEVNHDNMTTFNMGQLCAVSEGMCSPSNGIEDGWKVLTPFICCWTRYALLIRR